MALPKKEAVHVANRVHWRSHLTNDEFLKVPDWQGTAIAGNGSASDRAVKFWIVGWSEIAARAQIRKRDLIRSKDDALETLLQSTWRNVSLPDESESITLRYSRKDFAASDPQFTRIRTYSAANGETPNPKPLWLPKALTIALTIKIVALASGKVTEQYVNDTLKIDPAVFYLSNLTHDSLKAALDASGSSDFVSEVLQACGKVDPFQLGRNGQRSILHLLRNTNKCQRTVTKPLATQIRDEAFKRGIDFGQVDCSPNPRHRLGTKGAVLTEWPNGTD